MAKRSPKNKPVTKKSKQPAVPKRATSPVKAKKSTVGQVRSRQPVRLLKLAFRGLKTIIVLAGRALWTILFPVRPLLRPVLHYLGGVREEFRAVTWPRRREAWKLTFAVIVFALVFVLLVQIIDYGLRFFFEKVII